MPQQIKPAVGKETVIVIIQNGVGNEEPFRKAFPNNTIISCVVRHSVLVLITIRFGEKKSAAHLMTSTDLGWRRPKRTRSDQPHEIRRHANRPLCQPRRR